MKKIIHPCPKQAKLVSNKSQNLGQFLSKIKIIELFSQKITMHTRIGNCLFPFKPV